MKLWLQYRKPWVDEIIYVLLDIEEAVGEYTMLALGEFDYSEEMLDELISRWLDDRAMGLRAHEYEWTFAPRPPRQWYADRVIEANRASAIALQAVNDAVDDLHAEFGSAADA